MENASKVRRFDRTCVFICKTYKIMTMSVEIAKLLRKRRALPKPSNTNADLFIERLRKEEFARIDKTGQVYLDYTGGNLYPTSLVKKHSEFLQETIYGNPHSTNPASKLSEKMIGEAREKVADFFNAKDYHCVFTANASAALHIIAETYPFSSESHLLLTADNHNSVNGLREYCRLRGGSYTYNPMNKKDLTIDHDALCDLLGSQKGKTNKLFAFPAQSNVSGVCHSLNWVKAAKDRGWDVLLDAAAFAPTSALDLSAVQPDFVPISFYKIFGYPTGIGCLLIRKSVFDKLKKPSFAGGTITISSVRYPGYFLKSGHERFENGTVNYLGIPAVTNGLDFISRLSMDFICNRIKQLSCYFLERLQQLKHENGLSLIRLYGPDRVENRGATFLLNFIDAGGSVYPFQHIEDCANAALISLRSGCFCNPGIDETNHDISTIDLKNFFMNRKHGDYYSMIEHLGKWRGAVRVSMGYPTTKADIDKFFNFAKRFLNKTMPPDIFASR
jgi:selenocysteine lyase/cysteine desulfurase